jgi:hypothetical protein
LSIESESGESYGPHGRVLDDAELARYAKDSIVCKVLLEVLAGGEAFHPIQRELDITQVLASLAA